jgi:diguanylate cyclase (GGDEF)-like protein/PAS domain S-box-containing protein
VTFDQRRLAYRLAAILYLAGGIQTLINAFTLLPPFGRTGAALVGAAAVLMAPAIWLTPWSRWPREALLVLAPPALFLIGLGNWADPNPYDDGIYLFVLAVWIGVAQRRGVSLFVAPFAALTFWVPAHLTDHLPAGKLDSGTVFTALGSVMAAEVIAWLTSQLDKAFRRQSERDKHRFAVLVEDGAEVTFVVGADATLDYVSPTLPRMLGYPVEAWQGRDFRDLFSQYLHPDEPGSLVAEVAEALRTPGAGYTYVARMAHADGSWRYMECRARNLMEDEAVRGVLVNAADVTDRYRLEDALRRQASHDHLTDLPNRLLFAERVAKAQDRGGHNAVVFCDLDKFKAVNDGLGHRLGDHLLQAVAERLASVVRDGDTVARLGGDEFALLLPGASATQALAIAERLVALLSMPFDSHAGLLHIGVSVGVADTLGSSDVLADADIAMYAAKRAGGNRIFAYEPGMRQSVQDRLLLQDKLRVAVEQGQLRLHYQPIVSLHSGQVLGLEALLRWEDPQVGLRGPGDFITLAEETGLIVPIGSWAIKEACRQLAELKGYLPTLENAYVSVNVSPTQLDKSGLAIEVASALQASGLRPTDLVLEVTEGIMIGGQATIDRLSVLKHLGVRLAADDFGTGYSSLRYLQDFPFDILKVDKSFVDRLGVDSAQPHLVRTIVELAGHLGLEVVAEGVEDPGQRDRLGELGVLRGQGYLWSRPLKPADLPHWLLEQPEPALS